MVKRRYFSTLSGVLALTLSLSIFTVGCGKKTEEAPAADTNKPLTLKVEVFDRGNIPNGGTVDNNPMAKWIKEQVKKDTNVDVTFVAVPRSEEVNKLNVMMAASNAPDIVFTYTDALVAGYAKNGGLTDLTPYIDKYGKDLKKNLGDYMKYGQYYNKQYAIGSPNPLSVTARHTEYIRKDWVDALGAKLPTTKAELFTLLERFKNEDPGKVGKDKVVPWAMANGKSEKYYENFILSYVKSTEENKDLYVNDGFAKLLRDGSKDGVLKLNDLYNKGLISKDFALDTNETKFKQDISTGVAGFFVCDSGQVNGQIYDTLRKNIPTAELVPINCFENSQGKYYKNADGSVGVISMVPKANEKNAEAAIKYLNWMSNTKNYINIKYNIEGVNFKYDANGLPEYTGTVDDRTAKGFVDSMGIDYGIVYKSPDMGSVQKNKELNAKSYPKDAEFSKKTWDVSAVGIYNSPRFTVPVDAENKFGANLRQMLRDQIVRAVVAKPADFDKVYNEELTKMNQAGLKDVYEGRSKAYDEMKK